MSKSQSTSGQVQRPSWGIAEKIPKLRDPLNEKESYVTVWRQDMEDLLYSAGLQNFILSKATAEAAQRENPDAAHRARILLRNNISAEVKKLLIGCDSAWKIWSTLSTHYLGVGTQGVAATHVELAGLKLAENATEAELTKYLLRHLELNAQLKEIQAGSELSDTALATQMLLRLPQEFEHVRDRLFADASTLSTAVVYRDTVGYAKRRDVSAEPTQKADIAMHTSSGSGFRGECFRCRKIGHKEHECPLPPKDDNHTQRGNRNGRRRGNGRNKRGSKGQAAAFAISFPAFLQNGAIPNGQRDFACDTGASAHNTRHLEHFKSGTYKELEDGDTTKSRKLTGIGPNPVAILGYGDVELILNGGRKLTLLNVAYTPEAAANLISIHAALAALARSGDRDAYHKETLRSSKLVDGKGHTLLTGSLRSGLYFLDLATTQDFA